DLVADVRQKLFLGFLQSHKFFGVAFALCNVAAVQNEPVKTDLVLQVDGVELKKLVGTILAEKLDLDLFRVRSFLALLEFFLELVDGVRGYEVKNILSGERLSPIPERSAYRRVVIVDVAVKVDDEDQVGSIFHHRSVERSLPYVLFEIHIPAASISLR